jgi:hypothetical protein
MTTDRRGFAGMVLIGFLWTASPAQAAENQTWTFDNEETGLLPKGFVVAVGHWRIVAHDNGKVLTQLARNASQVFNVVLIEGHDTQDLDLSVKLRPFAGVNDQGGGLIWRAKDARNYYLTRFNPLENNFRVYTVVEGKRTQLQSAEATYPGAWCQLRVTMKGDHIICVKDGVKLLDVRDATFPGSGKIGLWSKSDAQTEFDELKLQEP